MWATILHAAAMVGWAFLSLYLGRKDGYKVGRMRGFVEGFDMAASGNAANRRSANGNGSESRPQRGP